MSWYSLLYITLSMLRLNNCRTTSHKLNTNSLQWICEETSQSQFSFLFDGLKDGILNMITTLNVPSSSAGFPTISTINQAWNESAKRLSEYDRKPTAEQILCYPVPAHSEHELLHSTVH